MLNNIYILKIDKIVLFIKKTIIKVEKNCI